MPPPTKHHGSDDAIASSDSPASRWPASTRSLEGRSSTFGSTLFDLPPSTAAPAPAVFDVCHVGVVLRAVLFVNAVVALGLMFAAGTVAAWASLAAVGTTVALPGVLLWLLAAC